MSMIKFLLKLQEILPLGEQAHLVIKYKNRPRGEEETRLSAKQLCASSILAVASKMKRIIIVAVVFASLSGIFLYFPKCTRAQNFSFEKSYQDYQYSLTQYQQAYLDYDYAKGAYLSNPTLNLKNDARNKTLNLLTNHDQLVKVYLTMLRMKLVEDNGLTNDEKNTLLTEIDSEIDWYNTDKAKLSNNDSLESLFTKSSELKSRYSSTTDKLIKKVLSYISLGEEIAIKNAQNQIYSDIRAYIDSKVEVGKLTLNPFDHWFADINNVRDTLSKNENSIREQIGKIASSYTTSDSSYESSVGLLSSSEVFLSQYYQYLTQVLNYIKNYEY